MRIHDVSDMCRSTLRMGRAACDLRRFRVWVVMIWDKVPSCLVGGGDVPSAGYALVGIRSPRSALGLFR